MNIMKSKKMKTLNLVKTNFTEALDFKNYHLGSNLKDITAIYRENCTNGQIHGCPENVGCVQAVGPNVGTVIPITIQDSM